MKFNHARTLYENPDATLDDLREAVTTFDETERIARRVLGGAHPLTKGIDSGLDSSRPLRNRVHELYSGATRPRNAV